MPNTNSPQGDPKTTSFRDSWGNLLRITSIRILVQASFFAMFVLLVTLTTFANLERYPGLRQCVGKLLEIDPLISIATAITTHSLYRGLLWSLVVLIPTLFLGRFFCGWVCPYGTLHHAVGWLFRIRSAEASERVNRFRNSQHVKYFILTAMLVAAVFGCLQVGLLDPICLAYRSLTGAVLPTVQMPVQDWPGDARLYQGAWLIGFLLFGLVAMNFVNPRFFCRVLCPLGALLGLLSRFAWWRIERDPDKCTECDNCLRSCEGACDPHTSLRKAECLVCFNCIEDCPERALSFKLLPSGGREVARADLPRRKVIFAAVTGALFSPFVRAGGRTTRDFSSNVIRPPGTVEELEFLKRCIKCGQCIRVCPTNTLQPGWFEAGLEGVWSPVLNFRMGYCQLHCTACGQVCPTGAIQRISVDRKLGLGAYSDQGPIRLGTAHIDRARCLPRGKNIPCTVCEEVCPTSPKAIYTERRFEDVRDSKMLVRSATANTVTLRRPATPDGMPTAGSAPLFAVDQWKGDGTAPFYVVVKHGDGTTESHRIVGNNVDTLTIHDTFARLPVGGEAIELQIALLVPKTDMSACIGCGICEFKCPIVGDRRAVYITPEGETRSHNAPTADRDRSLHLD